MGRLSVRETVDVNGLAWKGNRPRDEHFVSAGCGGVAHSPKQEASAYTSRLWFTAGPMKEENSGCGSNGRDLSAGWNCTPMTQRWSSYSIIAGRSPSGDMPENRMPCCSRRPR